MASNVRLIPNLLNTNLNSQALQLLSIMILGLIYFSGKFPIKISIYLPISTQNYYVLLLSLNWMVIECLEKNYNKFKIFFINNILVNKSNYGNIIMMVRYNITFKLIEDQS